MNIGFIGLGKLGLPCAVAIAERGHTIYGYDVNSEALKRYRQGVTNLYEPNIDKQLQAVMPRMNFAGSLDEVIFSSEIIFVAVQTPHPPELDGSVRHHHVRKDFDYSYLLKAATSIATTISYCHTHKTIAIISTVLPGTTRGLIYPAMQKIIRQPLNEGWGLCYNPSFIAMGQTVKDFLNPEFTLIGERLADEISASGKILGDFYNTIHKAPKLRMTWDEAETVKMTYNTFIGLKIIFANMIMQVCYNTPGADCDVVLNSLGLATERIISTKYLRGGMGDGGGCHPRDNLALAYLSDKLNLNYNIFDFVMTVREKQTEWLADVICQYALPKVILGKTYKPNTNLVDGSPSILLANILAERDEKVAFYDPITDTKLPSRVPSVYIIATLWPEFKDFDYVPGSVVIDPWGMIKSVPEDVKLISLGRGKS